MGPVGDLGGGASGGSEPPETGIYIGCDRVGDAGRVRLDVQADRGSVLVPEEMADENEVGQQLAAGVVRNEDGAGVRAESGPQVSALVSEDPG
jgi:hypothetical protein